MTNNNRRLAQKRKRRHQERVNKYHLNMKLQRESILENTLEGQIIKDYNIQNLYNSENESNLLSSYDTGLFIIYRLQSNLISQTIYCRLSFVSNVIEKPLLREYMIVDISI